MKHSLHKRLCWCNSMRRSNLHIFIMVKSANIQFLLNIPTFSRKTSQRPQLRVRVFFLLHLTYLRANVSHLHCPLKHLLKTSPERIQEGTNWKFSSRIKYQRELMLFRSMLTAVSPHVSSHGWRPRFKHCIVSTTFTQSFTYTILFVSHIFSMWWEPFGHIGNVWLALTRTPSHPNRAFTQPCIINSHSYPLKLTPEPQQTFWEQMGPLNGRPDSRRARTCTPYVWLLTVGLKFF